MDQTPATIPVIIEIRTSKAEREEIAVVEPVVPVVAEVSIERKVIVTEGTTIEPPNRSADHRRSDHPASTHRRAHTPYTHRGAYTASTHSGHTAAPKTAAMNTGTAAAKTTAVATATAGHSGRAHA